MRAGQRLRLIAFLIGGPILALVALDRAVVAYTPLWSWVAHEVPPLLMDPFRVEGVIRSTTPGPRNVPIIGNSVAQMGFDAIELERRFAGSGLRFPMVTVAGTPAVGFAMLADAVVGLEPKTAVYMTSASSMRGRNYLDSVYVYDVGAVPELFTTREILAEPRFHLAGLVGQAHVFARHRRAMQRSMLVRLGRMRWERLEIDKQLLRLRRALEGRDSFLTWVRDREPDVYPNPNTRGIVLLARRLRESGARLIVIDAPVHPIPAMLGIRKRLEHYRSLMGEMASTEGFDWVSAEELPAFDEDDFTDWVHANERGRERLTAFLADYLEARP